MDIDAGARLVEAIAPLARSAARPGADGSIGGFGGVFDLAAAGFRDPVLAAAADGVGTKLRVAVETGRHDTVGIDLVAMCVNDLAAQGAEPLFFLDYYAAGELSVAEARAVVAGIARGCREAGCALLGGETAEMPGLYARGDYDLAGFAVGAAERGALLDASRARAGDIVLGLASSGLHSNGFSLARRVVADAGLSWDAFCPFEDGTSLGEAFLRPTRIYARAVRAALAAGGVTGAAHITGGGLVENPPRAFGPDLAARIDLASWPAPPVFRWLARTGGIAAGEMLRVFNCGIGMTLTVEPGRAGAVAEALAGAGEAVHRIGRLEPRAPGGPAVVFDNFPDAAR